MENRIFLHIGGTKYAVSQLETDEALELSDPTQELQECADFILTDRHSSNEKHLPLIVTLGLNWKDLSMWEKATKMCISARYSRRKGPEWFDLDEILEAWATFGFEALRSS